MTKIRHRIKAIAVAGIAATSVNTAEAVMPATSFEYQPAVHQDIGAHLPSSLGFPPQGISLEQRSRFEDCRTTLTEKSIAPWLSRDFIFLQLQPKRRSRSKIRIGITGSAPLMPRECKTVLNDITVTYSVAALNGTAKIASSGSVRRKNNNALVVPYRKFKPASPGVFCVRQNVTVQSRSGGFFGLGDWAKPARVGSDLSVKPLPVDKNCSYN